MNFEFATHGEALGFFCAKAVHTLVLARDLSYIFKIKKKTNIRQTFHFVSNAFRCSEMDRFGIQIERESRIVLRVLEYEESLKYALLRVNAYK